MKNPLYEALFASNLKSGRTFLSLPDGTGITYQAFLAEASRFAHVLAEFGAKPGDRLALHVKKTPQALAVYAACVQAGIVFVPLNQAYTAAEVRYFLEDSGAKILVCDLAAEAELAPIAVSTGTEILTLDAVGNGSLNREANDARDHFDTVFRVHSDSAAILYTSGTTGRSKGAMLSQNNLISNARVLCQEWDFRADDVLLHALPIYHAHGLFVATNVCLLANARMIFLPKFSTDAVIQALP